MDHALLATKGVSKNNLVNKSKYHRDSSIRRVVSNP